MVINCNSNINIDSIIGSVDAHIYSVNNIASQYLPTPPKFTYMDMDIDRVSVCIMINCYSRAIEIGWSSEVWFMEDTTNDTTM